MNAETPEPLTDPLAADRRALEAADNVIRAVLSEMGRGPESDPILAVRALVAELAALRQRIRGATESLKWADNYSDGMFMYGPDLLALLEAENGGTS